MVAHGSRKQIAFIGLGSNLGARQKNISAALNALESTRGVVVSRVSSLFETDPVGGPADQPPYINAVAQVETTLSAERLLAVCLHIEDTLGRKRSERWGPRTIDLDLLLYGEEIHATAELTVPHPLLHERRFVLEPMMEIAPDLVHPVMNQTIRQLYESLGLPPDSGID